MKRVIETRSRRNTIVVRKQVDLFKCRYTLNPRMCSCSRETRRSSTPISRYFLPFAERKLAVHQAGDFFWCSLPSSDIVYRPSFRVRPTSFLLLSFDWLLSFPFLSFLSSRPSKRNDLSQVNGVSTRPIRKGEGEVPHVYVIRFISIDPTLVCILVMMICCIRMVDWLKVWECELSPVESSWSRKLSFD